MRRIYDAVTPVFMAYIALSGTWTISTGHGNVPLALVQFISGSYWTLRFLEHFGGLRGQQSEPNETTEDA